MNNKLEDKIEENNILINGKINNIICQQAVYYLKSKVFHIKSKEYSKTIFWDEEQKGLRILDDKKLEEKILPKYFRLKKFSSFLRQLNLYGFRKTKITEEDCIFFHKQFDLKDQQTFIKVKRKVTFKVQENQNVQIQKKQFNQKDNFNQSFERIIDQESQEKVLQRIVRQIQIKPREAFQSTINELKISEQYRQYFNRKKFTNSVYERIGLKKGEDDEEQFKSIASIEDGLLDKTKNNLSSKSFKWMESGSVHFTDTIGRLMKF